MDFANDEKYDNVLLGIIQQVNTLPNFLDILFGFLRRRTDLFYIMDSSQQVMGFQAGKAESLVLNAFKKHQSIFEMTTESPEMNKVDKFPESKLNVSSPKDCLIQPKVDSSKIVEKSLSTDNESVYVADAESYNGAVRDNYTWSQTIGELDVRVKLPETVSSSKEVKVTVDKKHINVSYHNKIENKFTSVVSADLCWEVKKHDVFWSLDRKENKILITIEKVQERWWDALFIGEETINTRKIDCSRPMSDLDDEAQAKIHKLMYDNQQKQLGMPTSDQQKINETLRKAWNVEGSPFKGTDFDLSKVDMVGNN